MKRKTRKKKEPRGWMAPRSGGYVPGEMSGVEVSVESIKPPPGSGGVVVRRTCRNV